MSDMEKKSREFIGYEYKEIITDSSKVSFLLDGYENFGWEQDEHMAEMSAENYTVKSYHPPQKKVVLRLKRNRKIINKMELTRLQRNFEACVSEIEELEKSKTSAATAFAIILGILGTAFMAGSTFAITAPVPHVILCILLAVPGFMGWILPCFVYKKAVRKQTAKVNPIIEEKYDEIYEICEKGNRLLI